MRGGISFAMKVGAGETGRRRLRSGPYSAEIGLGLETLLVYRHIDASM
ncbi:MAG TPA: hypothetical protein VJ001_05690 [Rhodocyclaceae bacterium]|nr:hypothetical protein [Rhodocyclaceae bacterium]